MGFLFCFKFLYLNFFFLLTKVLIVHRHRPSAPAVTSRNSLWPWISWFLQVLGGTFCFYCRCRGNQSQNSVSSLVASCCIIRIKAKPTKEFKISHRTRNGHNRMLLLLLLLWQKLMPGLITVSESFKPSPPASFKSDR